MALARDVPRPSTPWQMAQSPRYVLRALKPGGEGAATAATAAAWALDGPKRVATAAAVPATMRTTSTKGTGATLAPAAESASCSREGLAPSTEPHCPSADAGKHRPRARVGPPVARRDVGTAEPVDKARAHDGARGGHVRDRRRRPHRLGSGVRPRQGRRPAQRLRSPCHGGRGRHGDGLGIGSGPRRAVGTDPAARRPLRPPSRLARARRRPPPARAREPVSGGARDGWTAAPGDLAADRAGRPQPRQRRPSGAPQLPPGLTPESPSSPRRERDSDTAQPKMPLAMREDSDLLRRSNTSAWARRMRGSSGPARAASTARWPARRRSASPPACPRSRARSARRRAPPASDASSVARAPPGAGLRLAGLPSYQPPYKRHTVRTT